MTSIEIEQIIELRRLIAEAWVLTGDEDDGKYRRVAMPLSEQLKVWLRRCDHKLPDGNDAYKNDGYYPEECSICFLPWEEVVKRRSQSNRT